MKSAEEIMEILEAYDLTGSLRDAGELAGCSHHTVSRYVAARDAGRLVAGAASRPSVLDPYLAKIEELVERSKGKIRADVVHDRLVAMGYPGAERTTRRAVARAKAAYASGRRRVFRPWIPEPGMWAQYDFGVGPTVGGTPTLLLCLWLAWSRFRVVLPILDRAAPTVFASVDVALRRLGGVPTYLLTDNEKTVTVEHVAGVPVRNPTAVGFGRHYGLTVATCLPADPQTKGGSEATVRIAKADLVPTEANLLDAYRSFTELETACAEFGDLVNARPHRATRRPPVQMLAEERARLHPLPARPFTVLLGGARRVGSTTALVSFEGGQYSVPHRLAGQVVRVRRHGGQVVVTHVGPDGPVEVARHQATTPGSPALDDAHFPPVPAGPAARSPRPRTAAETEFCGLGDGARLWLVEAAAAGTTRMRVKMAEAVTLAGLHGPGTVDQALGSAATAGRFADGDLAAILTHQATTTGGPTSQVGEQHTLAQGTGGWNALGRGPVAS
ncbi:IS21 family transposase [Pseudofrankia asymbiotica]|uniref:Transposase n=1 Tax=Pseudofrankia asymbiotica TaxID=1834516 RepID=A0A1V2ID35_9ACTN|nr:IS21 family transposase [Pseudofrankia asymbiotica]ONH31108.1 transposase [Pseudofrankia asymbiotica]